MQNKIRFILDDENKDELLKAQDNIEFETIPGSVQIIINGEDIIQQSQIGEDRIIAFASYWIKKLNDIIQGQKVEIEHGDEPKTFIFKREEQDINCSVYDEYEEEFKAKDQKFPMKEYCRSLLTATKELEEQISRNENVQEFKMYKTFFQNKDNAIEAIKRNGILTQREIDMIFENNKNKFEKDFDRL